MAVAHELQRLNDAAEQRGYWLHRARLAGAGERGALPICSLKVRAGRIERIVTGACRDAEDSLPCLDLDHGLLLSAWVDAHVHLDKGHIAPRAGTGGGLHAAIAAAQADSASWTRDDLTRRMAFSLRCAYAYGTRALRTHIDWGGGEPPLAWDIAHELAQRWAGRIDMQCAALCPPEIFVDMAAGERVAREVAERGGVLGAFVYPMAGVQSLVERVFALAERFDLRLDFHADEHLAPNVDATRAILAAARKTRMGERVTCGHCCSLATVPLYTAHALFDEFADSGATLVSLPHTNLYLQDRHAEGAPRVRGIAPMREADMKGVKIALASDNHRDPFLPFGDLDLLSTLTVASFAAHLDQPFERWSGTVTTTPARALNLSWDGVPGEGAPADLVLLRARDSTEACSRPQADRRVVRAGRFIDTALPDYRELDLPHRVARPDYQL
ncbi:cytosine deaminase [Caballeronia sp. INDeC2]|uniref:cytosine deaminase n=1 Tax=Caballeronia sp. INDeC2 TaxID=2921747 RepID=UPI002027BDEF|nr:cytosine deaminase [Caballeronia sp. INDeC2]